MSYTYDPILVCISVLVAIVGAYACFDLVIRVQRTSGPKRRNWLALAALAIGGSIWVMHFIAMLAVQLPSSMQSMQYDSLTTLISGLVSILMTALALAIVVSAGVISRQRIVTGGIIMGAGITAMHYVGMLGMRGDFSLTYNTTWLVLSALIGVFASTLSLWLAMGLQLRGVIRRSVSAMVMGFSIAGVHYSGMFGTRFEPVSQVIELSQPILNPFSLGLITALVTFTILGWALLMLLPENAAQTLQASSNGIITPSENVVVRSDPVKVVARVSTAEDTLPVGQTRFARSELPKNIETHNNGVDDNAVLTTLPDAADRIPVQRNKKTFFISITDIASISADGHYTSLHTTDGQTHFCNIGFNKLLSHVRSAEFVRVHRSHAINLKCVVSFRRNRDKAIVNLGDDEHEVPVSRTHVATVQNALGLLR